MVCFKLSRDQNRAGYSRSVMTKQAPFLLTIADAGGNPLREVPIDPEALDVDDETHADTIIANRILGRLEQDGWIISNRSTQFRDLRMAIDKHRDDWALGRPATFRPTVRLGGIVPPAPHSPSPVTPDPQHGKWEWVWRVLVPIIIRAIWDVIKGHFPHSKSVGSSMPIGGDDKMQV